MVSLLRLFVIQVLNEEGIRTLAVFVAKVSFTDAQAILDCASSPHVNFKDLIFLYHIDNVTHFQAVSPRNFFFCKSLRVNSTLCSSRLFVTISLWFDNDFLFVVELIELLCG